MTAAHGDDTYQCDGITNISQIVQIIFASYEASPNQNIVLDNFAFSCELELRITGVTRTNNDIRITWNTLGGTTNFVQAAGALGASFSDVSGPIVVSCSRQVSVSYTDSGAVGHLATTFYRIRMT